MQGGQERHHWRKRSAEPSDRSRVLELALEGVTVIGRGAASKTIAAVIRAP
jgi:hypothetical protein